MSDHALLGLAVMIGAAFAVIFAAMAESVLFAAVTTAAALLVGVPAGVGALGYLWVTGGKHGV